MAEHASAADRSGSGRMAAAVFVLAWVLGAAVRWPYATAPAVHDDRVIERTIGLVWTGHQSWWVSYFHPHSGQVFPLGKVLYATELRFLGIDHPAWHLITHTVHAASAAALYFLLARYFSTYLSAGLAALMWATVAIGRWDNFLLWTAMGHAPWAVLGMLCAMICVTRVNASKAVGAPILLCLLLTALSLLWSVTLLLFPAIVLQYALLEKRRAGPCPHPWRWGLAFGIPTLLACLGQGLAVLWRGTGSDEEIHFVAIGEALLRAMKMLAVAAGDLTLWSAKYLASDELGWKITTGLFLLSLLAFSPSRSRWTVVVFFVPAIIFLFMVNLTRGSVEFSSVATSGRYYFWPVLAWCVAMGAIVDGAAVRNRRLALAVGVLILIGHVAHQSHVAVVARRQHDDLWRDVVTEFQWTLDALDELEAAARQGSLPLLPDIPVYVRPVEEDAYFLSTLLAVTGRAPTAEGQIRRIDEMTGEDVVRAAAALASMEQPVAREWARSMTTFKEEVDAVKGLSEAAAGAPLDVPDARLDHGGATLWLSQCVEWGLADPPRNLRFERLAVESEETRTIIEKLPGPRRRMWRRWMSQVGEPTSNPDSQGRVPERRRP